MIGYEQERRPRFRILERATLGVSGFVVSELGIAATSLTDASIKPLSTTGLILSGAVAIALACVNPQDLDKR